MPSVHVLRDGLRVLVRPVVPADAPELDEGFRHLSKETVRHRFLEPIKRLTPAQVRYLTLVDNRSHIALGAAVLEGGAERGIGVARCVRLEREPQVAEFALVVTDRYQGRGVGQLLLRRLARSALDNGIRTFRGYVRDDNAVMAWILAKCAAACRERADGVTVVEFLLGPTLEAELSGRPGARGDGAAT